MTVYLTRAEKCVARLIDDEYTTKEMALKLHLSIRTIEAHRHRLCKKLAVRSSYLAVALCKIKQLL